MWNTDRKQKQMDNTHTKMQAERLMIHVYPTCEVSRERKTNPNQCGLSTFTKIQKITSLEELTEPSAGPI
jgi:hypothetical protein